MVKIELDEKWLKEMFKRTEKEVASSLEHKINHIGHEILADMIKQAMKEELQKPENQERLKKIVSDTLVSRDSDKIIRQLVFGKSY